MPENYLMKVNDGEEVPIRLVGLIDEADCEALLNTEDGVNRVSTAENIGINDVGIPSAINRRFVAILKEYKTKIASESTEDFEELKRGQ